jgi:hypothetical protein
LKNFEKRAGAAAIKDFERRRRNPERLKRLGYRKNLKTGVTGVIEERRNPERLKRPDTGRT